jgi:MinD-like ATPase involved in chromosome partitioning or flagellar assembly/predicted acylesterase/phospholipase RssA
MTEKMPGTIITFYSYKGGTGRSMAVANVAWALACGGKKVLAIDWDLEAPGLHRYFDPFLVDKELKDTYGVIDFVSNFMRESLSPGEGDAKPDWYVSHASLQPYAVSLNYEFPEEGRLDFLPAGRQDASYPSRVNELDWRKFYDRSGWLFLEEARRQMRADYDYVLIDSRSGSGNISRICTSQMPDVLVPCFTLSSQSIDGALSVAQAAFEGRKQSGLKIFPVPMRLDYAESDKQEQRLKEAQDKFYPFPNHLPEGCDWEGYWDEVPIFYVPYYSYDAALAVFAHGRKAGSIFTAAETLAKYLSHGTVRQLKAEALPSKEERERVMALYAGQEAAAIDLSAGLNEVAENALVRLSPEERDSAWRVVQQLVSVAPSANNNGASRACLKLDDFSLSDRRIIRELQSSRLLQLETDGGGKQTVQLARDEFLHDWQSLREWLEKNREFLIWLAALREARQKWQQALKAGASRDGVSAPLAEDLLLHGDELNTALGWLQERSADIGTTEREYIKRSQRKHEPKETVYPAALRPNPDNVKQARDILGGKQGDPNQMLELAKVLKSEMRFSYARRLLARAISYIEANEAKEGDKNKDKEDEQYKEQHWKIYKELSLCTYKDQDLPVDERLDRALSILKKVKVFARTTSQQQETLGQLGSVYKRKWEIDNQRQNLERSLYYYLSGYKLGATTDQGYNGINAAFVLDQLASLEEAEAEDANQSSHTAEGRRERAREIREDIIKQVGALIDDPNHEWVADKWWYYATMAEAEFGLQNYDEAVRWLTDGQRKARSKEGVESEKGDEQKGEKPNRGVVYEWELETSARQLAALARLQDERHLEGEQFAQTQAWGALEEAFGGNAVPRTAFMGKIGLALSGGGFRASLYHLGVLARLAELDVLRYVEVLSCVSGGSIVGAHYYLMVRHLLQTNTEDEITREDYIRIVHTMIDQFVAGVQKNIRMRIALNPFKNLFMFWRKEYSRTSRAGELYEQCLFSRVKDDREDKKRWLNGLNIAPLVRLGDDKKDKDKEFAPKYQNWRRDAKVPILVLNAATLNTGHTWQFTASWMGESPAGIDSEINGNDRLRRMYYGDAPKKHQRVRLGYAVGASAAVSGVFEPLTFDDLYPGRIIRLVDGGVCDNQGVGTLLEQDCKVLLVSDASGQMESQTASSRSILGVLLRSTDIFQARVREAQYHDLKGRQRSGLLRSLMFVHLKADLEVDPIDWIDCQEPYNASDDARPASRRGNQTRYGIAKEIQELLSGIRTDLDSFSDAEAYALMTSGYRMTEYQFQFEKCVKGFPEVVKAEQWKFLEIEDSMKGRGDGYEYLKKLLAAGGSRAFKVWKIDPWLKYGLRIVLFLAATLIALFAYQKWKEPPLSAEATERVTGVANTFAQKLVEIGALLPTLTVETIAWSLVFAIFSFCGGYILTRILSSFVNDLLAEYIVYLVRIKDFLRRLALGVALSTIGFVAALIHLSIFDRRFLSLGSISNLKKKSSA